MFHHPARPACCGSRALAHFLNRSGFVQNGILNLKRSSTAPFPQHTCTHTHMHTQTHTSLWFILLYCCTGLCHVDCVCACVRARFCMRQDFILHLITNCVQSHRFSTLPSFYKPKIQLLTFVICGFVKSCMKLC